MKNETDLNNLEELLKTFKTKEDAIPSEIFRQNTRIRILNQISKGPSLNKNFSLKRNRFFSFRFALALVLILLMVSTGTILAAQSAGPGSGLYPIKIASENAALTLSPSSLKPKIALEIVKRRAGEISSEQNGQLQQGIIRYKNSIDEAKTITPSNQSDINKELSNEEKNLNGLLEQYGNNKEKENQNRVNQNEQKQTNFDEVKPSATEKSPDNGNTENITPKPQASKQPEASPTFNPVENVQKGIENTIHDLTATPSPESQDR